MDEFITLRTGNTIRRAADRNLPVAEIVRFRMRLPIPPKSHDFGYKGRDCSQGRFCLPLALRLTQWPTLYRTNGIMHLILASTSKYRRELLERLRLSFRCFAPDVDEEPFKDCGAAPASIAAVLARLKAESLAGLDPEAVVIGSDQVAELEGEVLGKPGTAENAVAQLERLAGRQHRLFTAVAIWHRFRCQLHVDTTTLAMRNLSRAELERYVAADRPLDCAGSYKIESLGISLFDAIETSDQTAIVGLPLMAVTTMLRQIGFKLP